MDFPTWGRLIENFCSNQRATEFYEHFANRRYNFAASNDNSSCRLVFLKDVLHDPTNKTLRRQDRFIWCRNLHYEGKNNAGLRGISFTVDKGNKRFKADENNILALPSQICVNNNRFFKSKQKTFFPFSTIFSYHKTASMMARNAELDIDTFYDLVESDSPYQPGTLIKPREGYFYPDIDPKKINREIMDTREHPCGIILGKNTGASDYVGKEFYRVRFGDTTYERVHPVQMEIIK